jgi:hypothetical protein
MRSERSRIATTFTVVTVALVVMLGIRPVSVHEIFAVYVLVLAAVALAALTRVARNSSDTPPQSEFDTALVVRTFDSSRPPELVRMEREITLGLSNAAHLYQRLLPILRDAAAARLLTGHNVDLERRPTAAKSLLGDDAWELLRPDRPAPRDRNAPGISLRQLRNTVSTLEKL